jgi:transposase InsO family protein
VSPPSGYYAWVKREASQRARRDAMLLAEIRAAHAASRGTYGAPRIHAELAAKGIRVGRKRIARLKRKAPGGVGLPHFEMERNNYAHATCHPDLDGSRFKRPSSVPCPSWVERPS